jgi:DNA-binding HxlR family transcriptional regulator
MPKQPDPRDCNIARTLDIVGERWTLLAMREVLLGVRTFDEIVRRTGAPRNILSARLGKLVDAGLLTRERYSDRPPRDRYEPTAAGFALDSVLQSVMAWGDLYASSGPAPTVFRHACGNDYSAVVVCAACGQPGERGSLTPVRVGGRPAASA